MTWMPHPAARRLSPAEEAFYTQQVLAQQALRRPPLGRIYNPESGAETALMVILALYIGTTVASYYLVRGMAPKKSANSYGAGAAAANLIMPIVGPVAVGLMAANADGKR